jgi:hypothetical protein
LIEVRDVGAGFESNLIEASGAVEAPFVSGVLRHG